MRVEGEKRFAEIKRETAETRIELRLGLDGAGRCSISTGVPFMDHMLSLMARHGALDLELSAEGDLAVDAHHTVEDTGICLGQALVACLGEKRGIRRFGHAVLPMDEALVLVALDVSGRGYLAMEVELPSRKVGDFDTELVEEFLRALAINGKITLHVRLLAGRNTHHIIEAIFKGLGCALKEAVRVEGEEIPSTKGVL